MAMANRNQLGIPPAPSGDGFVTDIVAYLPARVCLRTNQTVVAPTLIE